MSARIRTVAVLLSTALASACGGATPGTSGEDGSAPAASAGEGGAAPRSLVLVTIDTLRADHMSTYGYARPTTPFIDALARDGTLFQNAFAHAPLTLPSHSSIMTGQLPAAHGARTNWEPVRDEGLETLAERCREHGMETAAIVAGFVLNRRFGLDQGFDFYDDEFESSYRRAEEVFAATMRWVSGRATERPYFLWVHFMDAHGPYMPPPRAIVELGEALPRNPQVLEAARRAAILENRTPTEDELHWLEVLYDGEIRYVDAVLARLMGELDGRGMLDDALIVLTADHGEGFDHDYYFDHGDRLYDSQLHVPLLIVDRAGTRVPRGRVVEDLVRSVDILPTVSELMGWDSRELAGSSLAPFFEDGGPRRPRIALGETYLRRAKGYSQHAGLAPSERSAGSLFALRTQERKLIQTVFADRDARLECYDVGVDPAEEHDLAGALPEGAEDLRALLGRYAEVAGPISGELDPTLSADERAKLESLGYSGDGE